MKSPVPRFESLLLAALLIGLCGLELSGCAAQQPEFKTYPDDELQQALVDWRGDRSGLLWLRRDARITLELPTEPSRSTAELTTSGVLTRVGAGAIGAESFTLIAGSRSAPPVCSLRKRSGDSSEATTQDAVPVDPQSASRVDPVQRAYRLPLPSIEVGEMIEVHCSSRTDRPTGSGALWIGASGVPVVESMIQVRAPDSARVAMRVAGGSWSPLALPSDGQNVLAVRAEGLKAREEAPAYVRWALRGASPRGFDQRWIQTWFDATLDEKRALCDSKDLARSGLALPFSVGENTGEQAARAAFIWVRDRLSASEEARDGVRPARRLRTPIETNTLTATDKVHLLSWLLDSAKIQHRFAVARPTAHPALDADYPTTRALQTPLLQVFLDGGSAWFDPSCADCKPGEVRPGLQGGQVLLLPAKQEKPQLLQSSPWPPSADSSTSAPP